MESDDEIGVIEWVIGARENVCTGVEILGIIEKMLIYRGSHSSDALWLISFSELRLFRLKMLEKC